MTTILLWTHLDVHVRYFPLFIYAQHYQTYTHVQDHVCSTIRFSCFSTPCLPLCLCISLFLLLSLSLSLFLPLSLTLSICLYLPASAVWSRGMLPGNTLIERFLFWVRRLFNHLNMMLCFICMVPLGYSKLKQSNSEFLASFQVTHFLIKGYHRCLNPNH